MREKKWGSDASTRFCRFYASRAALEAAAIPTSKATMISTEAITPALEVNEALTTAMKPIPAIMIITAIATTYPRIGLTVSSKLMQFTCLTTINIIFYQS